MNAYRASIARLAVAALMLPLAARVTPLLAAPSPATASLLQYSPEQIDLPASKPWRWTSPYGTSGSEQLANPDLLHDDPAAAEGHADALHAAVPIDRPLLTGIWPWSPRTPTALRHVDVGEPLEGTSWLNRPYHAGAFLGIMYGGQLIGGLVDQHEGPFGGVRIGCDYDYYWGCETRMALANIELGDTLGRDVARTGDILQWDLDLNYYPWGDSRWRPYATLGLGVAAFDFSDRRGRQYNEILFSMPIGLGLEYGLSPRSMLRLDLLDNMALSGGTLESMHNVSLTLGLETRFGGHRPSYWPWNPSRYLP